MKTEDNKNKKQRVEEKKKTQQTNRRRTHVHRASTDTPQTVLGELRDEKKAGFTSFSFPSPGL